MGENKFIYDKYLREETIKNRKEKKKNESLKKAAEIEKMTKDEASLKLSKTLEIYKMIKYNLDKKKKDLKELKHVEEVRKYILIESSIKDINEELESTSEELSMLEQKVCDHDLLYLINIPKKSMAYIPFFRCLSCGKAITGLIKNNQLCVNNEFLSETEKEYHGSNTEFLELLLNNEEFENDGLILEERYILIRNKLKRDHKNGKKIELKRRY